MTTYTAIVNHRTLGRASTLAAARKLIRAEFGRAASIVRDYPADEDGLVEVWNTSRREGCDIAAIYAD